MSVLRNVLFFILLSIPVLFAKPEQQSRASVTVFLNQDKLRAGDDVGIVFKIKIEPGWHINSNRPKEDYLIKSELTLSDTANFQLHDLQFPAAKDLKLGFSDVPLSVFEGDVFVVGKLRVKGDLKPGEYFAKVMLSYQACNNANCEAPADAEGALQITAAAKGEAVQVVNDAIFQGIANQGNVQPAAPVDDSSLAGRLEKSGLFLALPLLFLLGLGLNLTPCVYPLIPITIGYFGGQSEGKFSRLVGMGALYLLGIALTYSVVGVVTALSGALFGSLLQNTYVILFIVLVFVVLSLSMFGVYEFKLPDALMQKAGGSKGGFFGAFFMGLTMGIVAAPCIGPVVLALVTVVAAKHDAVLGFLWFFSLSLGLGAPYFLLAIFSGKIKNLPRSGVWMEAVKHIFGFMLLGLALYYASPLLPKVVAHYLLPFYLLVTGFYILLFEKAGNNLSGFRVFKIVIALLSIAVGAYSGYPVQEHSIAWVPYTKDGVEAAKAAHKPIIIDFYADWCIPCKELDKATFGNTSVISESERFAAFKVDLTSATSDASIGLTKEFKITGVPTVVLIDNHGVEVDRVTKFVEPDSFLESLKHVK